MYHIKSFPFLIGKVLTKNNNKTNFIKSMMFPFLIGKVLTDSLESLALYSCYDDRFHSL